MSTLKLGYALCGSHCTHAQAIARMRELSALGHSLVPIMSTAARYTDTRFGKGEDIAREIEGVCGRKIICTVADAEPLGPKEPLDALIISPCTGNTLAKIASGITDTAVTMAAKAHLRQDRPLVIALATNDAMSQNLGNISRLLSRKSVYFVPLRQDDPIGKPHSLVADFSRLHEALAAALEGKQLRPLFV